MESLMGLKLILELGAIVAAAFIVKAMWSYAKKVK